MGHRPLARRHLGVVTVVTTGRLTVGPGQTLDPYGWGNPVWDQTVNCFNSAADRANQWSAPHTGSLSWLDDSGTLWVYRGTAWMLLGPLHTSPVPAATHRLSMQTGRTTVTTDAAGGQANITFPVLFATGTTPTVIACPGVGSGGFSSLIVAGLSADPVRYFTVVCRNNTGGLMLNSSLVVNWSAIGEI